MRFLDSNHVKYGLIMSGVVILCLLIMEVTGQNSSFEKSPYTLLWTFIAPAVVWYLGISAKKKGQKGKLSFKEGLREGFKISLVFALTSPFVFMFYYLLINPGILEYARKVYGLNTASDMVVISVDMLVQFISAVIFGTIYGAVISIFLKSK